MHATAPKPFAWPAFALQAPKFAGASLAARLRQGLQRLLEREPTLPASAGRFMAMAARYDHTQPGFAADLRGAALRHEQAITRAR